jgi:integrase
MPHRDTLGDQDESLWETGLNGKPADPWQHHMYVVLQNRRTAELFTFVTPSRIGRRAVGNLLKHYERLKRQSPGDYPLVKLRVGGFQHFDDRVGWVKTPTFVVVGAVPKVAAAKPDTPAGGAINDSIPDDFNDPLSGLDACFYGTHSLRRTKATLIYKKTGNLRAVQLLLGHTKVESTVRYLGIEVDDALAVAEQIDV